MGQTRRWQPRNGEFKALRGSKKKRNKERRAQKAFLQSQINLESKS